MKSWVVCLLCLIAFAAPAHADEDWVPLYDRVDPDLQSLLENRLNAHPEWRRLISRKKLAVGLVDLNGDAPRFARVNGNIMMYTASLPKIAILLAIYTAMEEGLITETDEIANDLAAMIRTSSNSAAARLTDLVGLAKIEATLRDQRYGFYEEKRGGGLWMGKRYAKSGRRVGDPIFNISHGATATQVCRFFYLLVNHRLINPEYSERMLADLADPRLHHKFVASVEERAPKARLYRKSGTWRHYHSDAILVRGTRWRDYILVGLVESENGEAILRQLLPTVEELIVPPEYAESTDW